MSKDPAQYYLVKLVKGSEWKPGMSLSLIDLQFKHMQNLWRLQRAKKTVLSGPLADDGEIRGIVIFKVDTEEEVRELIERDPAVRAGRLSYEISRL